MKAILIILSVLILSSCNNIYISESKSLISDEQKEELTTLKLLNSIDTTQMYYVVLDGSTLYTISTDMVIEHRVKDTTGKVNVLGIIILALIGVCFIVLIVFPKP